MVVAKNDEAQLDLAKQFFVHSIERKYIAIVWGNIREDEGTIVGNIGRDPSDRMKFRVFPDGDHGKHAVTHYKVIERFGFVTVVECILETGRTHQIRVQFASRGCPLVGDGKYGSRVNAASPALWSYALTLPGVGGKEERFCALPEMQGAWEPFSDALSRLDTLI